MEEYHAMAKELGIPSRYKHRDPESELLMREISELQKSKGDLEGKLMQAQTDFLIMQQRLKDPRMIEQDGRRASSQDDPNMSTLNQQLMALEYQLRPTAVGRSSAVTRRKPIGLQKQLAAASSNWINTVPSMKQQHAGRAEEQAQSGPASVHKEFQIMAGMLSQQIAALDKSIKEKTEKLMAKSEQSVDLDTNEAELEQLQEIANDMSIKLETLDVEASAPPSEFG